MAGYLFSKARKVETNTKISKDSTDLEMKLQRCTALTEIRQQRKT